MISSIEDLIEWADCFALTGQHRCRVLVGNRDEVVGFEVPLVDDALLEFVVRARRYARTAQRDEPWLFRRRVAEPSHYVAYCESRRTGFAGGAGSPPDGRVAELEIEIKALREERDKL